MALPVVLLLTTLLFLVITMVKASRSDVGIWKNSALAVLLHDFTDDARKEFGTPWDMFEARDRAGHFMVKFEHEKLANGD